MPDRIGKYEVRGQIGRGAMGTVYEGFDASIGRRVAIKVLRTEVFEPSQLPDLLARFKREAQSAGQLSHPNIVTIFEYGEENGAPYIVMEYMTGEELGKRMNAGTRFPLDQVARIVSQLLGALGHAHEHGVVHRDLKPSNMFLLKDGSIKVVDFGIARVESSDLTETGAMLGTPAYMSPEQCLGRRVDHRSDLFSAGVILYQLLTGDKPFTGSTTTIIQKVLRMDPLPPSELDPTLSPAWDQVIAGAMAKMPEARYQSAQEFADAVRGALGPVARAGRGADATEVMRTAVVPPKAEAPPAKPPEKPAAEPAAKPAAPPRRSSFWPVAVIVLLAAAGAGGYLALNRAPPPEPVALAPAPPAVDEEQVRREVEQRLRREYEEKEAARRTAERIAAEKAAAERAAAERAAAQEAREKLAAERAAADKLAAERAAAARLAAQRAEAERVSAAAKAAAERAAAEKAAALKAAAARAAAEKAAAERAAQEKASATQVAAAGAAAKDDEYLEPPTPLDGAWAGTAQGPRQCPSATYKVTIKNGDVRGTAQWERSARQHEVRGYVHDESSAIFIVATMDRRTPYSRFMVQLENGRLIGRELVTCSLGPYSVSMGRQ